MLVTVMPNEFGKTNEKAVVALENSIGFKLPESYRNFLLKNNGGRPQFDTLKIVRQGEEELWSVNYFYGIHKGEYWTRLLWHVDALKGRMPKKFLPIIDNHGGDHYVINLSSENYGKIYLWNHNQEAESNGQNYYENISFLFDSFEDFVIHLIEDKNDIQVTITETDDEFIIE